MRIHWALGFAAPIVVLRGIFALHMILLVLGFRILYDRIMTEHLCRLLPLLCASPFTRDVVYNRLSSVCCDFRHASFGQFPEAVLQYSHSRRAPAHNIQCHGVRNGASWTLVGSQDTNGFLWILVGFNRDMPCTCTTRQFVLGSLHAPERVKPYLSPLVHARDENCTSTQPFSSRSSEQ